MNDVPLKISVAITDESAIAALANLPPTLARNLEAKLDLAGEEVAREEKLAAPKVFATLAESIRVDRDAALSRFIGPNVAYAVEVEKGTGPAAGHSSYFPNVAALMPWLQQHPGVSIGSTRAGAPARQRLRDQLRDRAWALARHIATAGTKPHPFIAPTFDKVRPRVEALIQSGVDDTLAQFGGAQA